ncbi:hypothetical protein SMACR_07071 [Sordaria macrospora]|uniref:WGS project CABT00000000 data, contig 2.39 n=2 Tax=Sordaria macrospora TaxID=5147 RepID=F7W7G4_SORMK|nr:uncharacterized protein SMAC_07071 [Sordaria macrospora k-hell]KAA8630142.1 hypothetical protein SMACR_07071 [Sordaria macrospora]KAH7632169.1 hypothetical protein B0T09DRAFT_356574 [Sordaria sp. MPI-SDFR-AT-0083]WPJ63448.1 hypothetical protein SMAC4_07071 [Sordaria macrospora]CCC13448.1 unnamed protein product [Sordaria macrospora k-hell]
MDSQPSRPSTPRSATNGLLENGEGLREMREKSKGRQKLLRGLQRISSSPALAPFQRQRSSSSPYHGHGTLSCVSLATPNAPSPFGQASISSSYFSHGFSSVSSSVPSTAPTTPGLDTPGCDVSDPMLAARKVGHPIHTTTSIALPHHKKRLTAFNLWANMPHEIRIHVLSFLSPKELVRTSRVSKEFYNMCYDGQLWTRCDASEFYQQIPAEALAQIIVSAGSFIKDLNLRGCVQLEHHRRAEMVVKASRNLVNATLEGCRNLQRQTLHDLIKRNNRLVNLNLTGLPAVCNTTLRLIAESCPQLEMLNVSWCKHMDAKAIQTVVEGCPKLKDLRVGEVKGFKDLEVAKSIFTTNNLERLVLAGCEDLSDAALQTMMHGEDPEIDILTNNPMVSPRKLRHLDLSRCNRLTSQGVKSLGHLVPELEGLILSGITALTDSALESILASTPRLTHLELEDLGELTNSLLSEHLAKAPCASKLEHLSIGYCGNLGDTGMLPVFRACTSLRSVIMDNTRISDLVLAEAASMVRQRAMDAKCRAIISSLNPHQLLQQQSLNNPVLPNVTLHLTVYDCGNVTWTGIREVLSRNTEPMKISVPTTSTNTNTNTRTSTTTAAAALSISSTTQPSTSDLTTSIFDTATADSKSDTVVTTTTIPAALSVTTTTSTRISPPTETIALKCYYGWQQTVDEHTKRVLRGAFPSARRLEAKWAQYMQAEEEERAGGDGAGRRRRRRRAREAAMVHADEEGGGVGSIWADGDGDGGQGQWGGAGAGGGGRRRERGRGTVSCAVM